MGFFTETSAYVQFEPLDVFKSTLKDKKKKEKRKKATFLLLHYFCKK